MVSNTVSLLSHLTRGVQLPLFKSTREGSSFVSTYTRVPFAPAGSMHCLGERAKWPQCQVMPKPDHLPMYTLLSLTALTTHTGHNLHTQSHTHYYWGPWNKVTQCVITGSNESLLLQYHILFTLMHTLESKSGSLCFRTVDRHGRSTILKGRIFVLDN